MSFFSFVWKNLRRRPTRTFLTLFGIVIGIAAVVALTGFAKGLETSWNNAYKARGTDIVITKVTSRNPLPAIFDPTQLRPLLERPETVASAGLLSDMMGIEDATAVLVFGWEYPSFLWDHLKLREGNWPAMNQQRQLALGSLAAETLGKRIGDTVQIEFDEFTVTAIFESPALVENGAVVMPLGEMQRVTDRADRVNFLNLRLRNPAADIPPIKQAVKEQFHGFTALEAGEVASRNTGIEIMRAMSWATSIIAVIVGASGVANTMLMSVFERVKEIGILLAIGWKPRHVMLMILLESLLLSLLGGLLGTFLGLGVIHVLQHGELLRGRLAADVGPQLFLTAFTVATGLGLGAGLYPAWRASRLEPSIALRAE